MNYDSKWIYVARDKDPWQSRGCGNRQSIAFKGFDYHRNC